MGQAIGQAIRAPVAEHEKALEQRVFYTGNLGWYYQAGVGGSLTMTGYDTTPHGGRITSVTACLYNESAFSRNFIATALVRQGSQIGSIQSIQFQRSFSASRFSCHTLTGFDAEVGPGEFAIGVSYSRLQADNIFLGLGATSAGQTFDVQVGSARPPFASGEQGPEQIRGVGIKFVIDVNDGPVNEIPALKELDALILPGFTVDASDPLGETTLLGVRNSSGSTRNLEIRFFGDQVTASPLRADGVSLGPFETYSGDIGDDLTSLEVAAGSASGLALISPSNSLVGDYLRLDQRNAFASAGRLLRAADLCDQQEIRFLDFGSGALLRILVNQPVGDTDPSFTFNIYDERGLVVDQGEYVTSNHLNVVKLEDLTEARFGTMVLDFTSAGGGWAGGTYSAFGLFSVDMPSHCFD